MPDQIDMDPVKEFAELTLENRTMQDKINDNKKRLAKLAPKIRDNFEEAETTKVTVAGVGTVFLQKQGWARLVKAGEEATREERERANAALEAAGLGEYVTKGFNSQSLSALFREMSKQGEDLPPELEGAIFFDEYYEPRVRAAPKPKAGDEAGELGPAPEAGELTEIGVSEQD